MAYLRMFTCDRCGEKIEGSPPLHGNVWSEDGRRTAQEFDLCAPCWKSLGIRGTPWSSRSRVAPVKRNPPKRKNGGPLMYENSIQLPNGVVFTPPTRGPREKGKAADGA
jgi:hypothetical protein